MSVNTLLQLPLPLVLASGSPRRKALMEHMGYEFTISVPDVDEDVIPTSLPPANYVEELAVLKAQKGASQCSQRSLVIGSDTTVVLNGRVLNKPVDEADAKRMLSGLSGNTHVVYTGIAIVDGSADGVNSQRVVHNKTEVTFRELSEEEINAYVASGSPLDKAGSYGIQDDFGAVFVQRINGCYYTIVGLPMELLYTTLRSLATEISVAG